MSLRRVISIAAVGAAVMVALAAPAGAQPDFKKAAEHYKNAEAAMAAGKFDYAASEYGVAYEITRDPVLFFKIAGAADKAGKCPLAITYYRRYLKEASPNEDFRKKTTERIAACGGKLEPGDAPAGSGSAGAGSGSDAGAGSGSGAGAGSGSDAGAGSGAGAGSAVPAGSGSDAGAGSGSGSAGAGSGSGSSGSGFSDDTTITLGPNLQAEKPSGKKTTAWIAVGTSVAAVTIGSVLLMSASSTEKDIEDLYANGASGRPATFEGTTKERYDELITQGKRYNTLAGVSFGVAGAAAALGITLFIMDHGHGTAEKAHALRVVPTLDRGGGGFAALGHF